MSFLYHGSCQSGLKKLEPHPSTHGNLVYATKYKELALIFSGKCGDDLTYTLFRNSDDEPWQIVERVPGAFSKMFEMNHLFILFQMQLFMIFILDFPSLFLKKE